MSEGFDDPFVPIVDEDGRVTGMLDRTTAEFLASTEPGPTQASLDAAFERVTPVPVRVRPARFLTGGYSSGWQSSLQPGFVATPG